jgi:hypothetical protein
MHQTYPSVSIRRFTDSIARWLALVMAPVVLSPVVWKKVFGRKKKQKKKKEKKCTGEKKKIDSLSVTCTDNRCTMHDAQTHPPTPSCVRRPLLPRRCLRRLRRRVRRVRCVRRASFKVPKK